MESCGMLWGSIFDCVKWILHFNMFQFKSWTKIIKTFKTQENQLIRYNAIQIKDRCGNCSAIYIHVYKACGNIGLTRKVSGSNLEAWFMIFSQVLLMTFCSFPRPSSNQTSVRQNNSIHRNMMKHLPARNLQTSAANRGKQSNSNNIPSSKLPRFTCQII